jgi:hypothetical protein
MVTQTSRSIQLTNSMEHSPFWEYNNHSASQEIPRLLLNPKVYYSVHKNLTSDL